MARRTKEEAQETRQNILAAAVDVFSSRGVALASLEEIAEAAGVTRGAVYWHFKNKSDIFEALQEGLHQSFMDMILQDLEKDHPEPLRQLEQLYVTMLQEVAKDAERQKVLKLFNLKCDYSGEMACFLERLNERKGKSVDLITRYFERAQKKGHISKDMDPKVLAISSHCYLSGICCEYMRNPALFDLDKSAPLLVSQLFTGIGHTRS